MPEKNSFADALGGRSLVRPDVHVVLRGKSEAKRFPEGGPGGEVAGRWMARVERLVDYREAVLLLKVGNDELREGDFGSAEFVQAEGEPADVLAPIQIGIHENVF